MEGGALLTVVMGLVVVVAVGVSGTPLERPQADETLAPLSSFEEVINALKEVVEAEKSMHQDLVSALQNVASSQVNLQRFMTGLGEVSNEVGSGEIPPPEGESESESSLHYFTRQVVLALNSGNNTQITQMLTELKTLNRGFKSFFRKMTCPDPFVPMGDECFNFQLEDKSWEESRQRCLRMGADLAEPKNITMVRLYIAENYPRKNRRNFWIGAVNNNKVWEWLSGNPVMPGYWYTNEPSGNGECLAMFDGWEHPLTDFPCENQRRAVCERKVDYN